MPIDTITLVATKTDLENRGLTPADSGPIAVVTSMLGNPVMGLFVGRSMADKKLAQATTQTQVAQPIVLASPPVEPPPPKEPSEAPTIASLPGRVAALLKKRFDEKAAAAAAGAAQATQAAAQDFLTKFEAFLQTVAPAPEPAPAEPTGPKTPPKR